MVHAIPKTRFNRRTIAFHVSDANLFSIEIRGQIHQRQLQENHSLEFRCDFEF